MPQVSLYNYLRYTWFWQLISKLTFFSIMFQIIYDEVIEYEDGTPASASQLAKDIVEFLMWTSNSEHDERKRLTIKVNI